MWVRFLADFNWRQPSFTIAYKTGMVLNVPHDAAEAAIAAGKAERQRKTNKDEEPLEWQPEADPASEEALARSLDESLSSDVGT